MKNILGEYLKTRSLQAVQLARWLGISLELHSFTEVERIQSEEGGFRLFCRNRTSGKHVPMEAAEVLIATGHWQKKVWMPFFYAPGHPKILARMWADKTRNPPGHAARSRWTDNAVRMIIKALNKRFAIEKSF